MRCPRCGSTDVNQYADHCSHGFNGYICNHCNYHWGN